jgi:hypothetical protein
MAGSFKVEISADVGGPFMHADIGAALDGWAKDVAKELGDEGVRILKAWHFKGGGHSHSGGGFQANLKVLQRGPVARIPGPAIKGVVWSPWLEGVSKRNSSTRFKGYGLFRKTAARLRKHAPQVAERELAKIMPKLGGG